MTKYLQVHFFVIATAFAGVLTGSVFAQLCNMSRYDYITAPGLVANGQFGKAIASLEDWLFVGGGAAAPGAVQVFRRNNGVWSHHQVLQPGPGEPDTFGASLAADGNLLIVGTQVSAVDPGGAYAYELENGSWVFKQKLLGFGGGEVRGFGWSVAIRNDLALIGCRLVVDDGVSGMGAAFVFQHDGTSWIAQQRLTSDAPAPVDRFGSSVSISDETLLVGAPRAASGTPKVFVFGFDGNQWSLQQTLIGVGYDPSGFGSVMALDGDTLVVGGRIGIKRAYFWNGSEWAQGPALFPVNYDSPADFGISVAVRGNVALIGASQQTTIHPGLGGDPSAHAQAGRVYVFDLNSRPGPLNPDLPADYMFEADRLELYQPFHDTVMGRYGVYACWLNAPQPDDWGELDLANLGLAVAFASQSELLASSRLVRPQCWATSPTPDDAGAVYSFTLYEENDCNANGLADRCEYNNDCNGNYVPDSCDAMSGAQADCNMNAVPDECENGFRYQMDTGLGQASVHAAGSNSDLIWLNQFRVIAGGQYVTHVAFQTTSLLPRNTPVTVMVYSDPNNDGNPADAILLTTATTTAASLHVSNDNFPGRMVSVPVEPTYVGPVGQRFFIGAVLYTLYLNDGFIWCGPVVGPGPSSLRRSWHALAPPGEADIQILTANAFLAISTFSGPFVLRAVASDCNGNGIADSCDIANGIVQDVNTNGIPDACEVGACRFADIAPDGGDGVINVNDLLAVINNWGQCSPCFAICPGDVNEDCLINVNDLLGVINAWGPCQ